MNQGVQIVFIGRPGCGKGTQCEELAGRLQGTSMPYDLIMMSKALKQDERALALMKQSKMVPCRLTFDIWKRTLASLLDDSVTKVVIHDGILRKSHQTRMMLNHIDGLDVSGHTPVIIEIKISLQEAFRRRRMRIKQGGSKDRPDGDNLFGFIRRQIEYEIHSRLVKKEIRRHEICIHVVENDGTLDKGEIFLKVWPIVESFVRPFMVVAV